MSSSPLDRLTALGSGLPPLPERLLLAHARGEVLFVAGAGISLPSGLPDFRSLVVQTYARLDRTAYAVIASIPRGVSSQWDPDTTGLNDPQKAEVRRFISNEYDVVLGMLERRMDGNSAKSSTVRQTISQILRGYAARPAPIHRALMRLADRGGMSAIVTTNFDLLLEDACPPKSKVQTYTLGGIPRPGHSNEFTGVLHIHGALDRDPARTSDLVISDQDFGEFYLRRRATADFIYDSARLFHLVLVGYSANDPPMRYLLNAVAADGSRFHDLKECFTLVGFDAADSVTMEDWKGRGITPIPYDSADNHSALLRVLERWASLSAINGKTSAIEAQVRRIVKVPRTASNDADRDLFDHLFRRGRPSERNHLAAVASKANAGLGWLDAVAEVLSESNREGR